MQDTIERKRLAILKFLTEQNKSVSSQVITEHLESMGYDMSERTVRFHLLTMDKLGLTKYVEKHGRQITDKGREELNKARVHEKVGFLASKISRMTYKMTFNIKKLEGTVVVNVSLIEREQLKKCVPLIKRVYKAGYAMGKMITLFKPDTQVGEMYIPEGFVGIGTVCSITLNGVLLANGIPTVSKFGGLLEIENSKPTRFVAIINYDGTSLDPLEIFIRSGMTDYIGATSTGNGLIGASFRELPAESRERVLELADRLEKIGLGGFLEIGYPGQPLRDIPINDGIIGAIVIGGLNPIAILEETGIKIHSRALSGLVDYKDLFHFDELDERIKNFI